MDQNINNPKISIVTPSFNRAAFIGKAIQSAQAQTFSDWEMLILDDASEDGTQAVVSEAMQQDSRIKYYKNEKNVGISKNRNQGLRLARGEFIATLDSDDVWLTKDKLEKQLHILMNDQTQKHTFIGSHISLIDAQDTVIGAESYNTGDASIRSKMLIKNQFAHSSILMRKKSVLEVGGYDESLEIWEDYDLWLRLGAHSAFINLDEYTTGYRIHTANISKTAKGKSIKTSLAIIKKYKSIYPGYTQARFKLAIKAALTKLGFFS